MTDKELESKRRIINQSRVLFAEKGFAGTTIRDIAKAADVNVASVNYYFSSKEKLFEEVLQSGYLNCSEQVACIMAPGKKLEDGLVEIFRFFLDRRHDLLSMFKLLMTIDQDKSQFQSHPDQAFGPPGGRVISEAIAREVGRPINEEDLHWGIKTLFSHVVHMAIMYNCCFKDNTIPYTSDTDIEKSIRRLCKVVLADLS